MNFSSKFSDKVQRSSNIWVSSDYPHSFPCTLSIVVSQKEALVSNVLLADTFDM